MAGVEIVKENEDPAEEKGDDSSSSSSNSSSGGEGGRGKRRNDIVNEHEIAASEVNKRLLQITRAGLFVVWYKYTPGFPKGWLLCPAR